MKQKTFKIGELYCGPGGLAYGASKARLRLSDVNYQIEHAWANDYDSDSCETFKKNILRDSKGYVVCGDIREFIKKDLEPIDGFAYGFPCNDFSIVGEQNGMAGKFGGLYSYGVEIINRLKPKFFIAENVGGIRSANEGKAFSQILNELAAAGNNYELTAHLYKAEEYGIPQTRHRIIIVGIEKKLNKRFMVPKPTHKFPNFVTVKDALLNRPLTKTAQNHEMTNQSKHVIERLKFIKPGENAWTANLPKELQLNVKGAKLSQIYKRLELDKPAYTITGSGGGGTHVYHWSEPRALTNRERARLQTFPDNFVFCGSKESVRKQIGMAVPPLLAKIIFTSVIKTLIEVPYPYLENSNINYRDQYKLIL